MTNTAEIIDIMKASFNPEAAKGVNLVYQFEVTDSETFHAAIDDGVCEIKVEAHEKPNVTLIMESKTMINVMTGKSSGMSAFMMGKMKATGELMHGPKLNTFFTYKG